MQARIRQTCLFAAVALGLVVVLAGTALAQSGNTSIGTWKLNIAKSTFAAGTTPKSGAFTVAAAGADVKVTVDWVAATGTVSHYGFTVRYDGKDYPITGNPNRGPPRGDSGRAGRGASPGRSPPVPPGPGSRGLGQAAGGEGEVR